MNEKAKAGVDRDGLKSELKKEFLTESIPSAVILAVVIALICLEFSLLDHVFFMIIISIGVIVGLIYIIKSLFTSIKWYFMISADKFDVVTDKLYRIGVGENRVRLGKGPRPDPEKDNNKSTDVLHFSRYGSFIPKVKDQGVCFAGDEFYLVVLKDKNKSIVKAYNAKRFKYIP